MVQYFQLTDIKPAEDVMEFLPLRKNFAARTHRKIPWAQPWNLDLVF